MIGIVCLILGAILGVMADRLWRRYEQIPRLDIIGSVFLSVDGEGYTFTITNRGPSDIPPFQIYIYNPRRGSISFFTRSREGNLLPDQKVEYKYTMIKNGRLLSDFLDFYRDINNTVISTIQRDKFVFRLQLDDSDKIIYENRTIGNAFVKIFQDARENRRVLEATFCDMMALQCRYEPLYRKLFKNFGLCQNA